MEVDTLLSAFRDFEKKGKKETCPVLDQFLCHIAKTGETMIQWSQFKSYFLFKLEKVMDDFKASCPEQRGPANPNVENIPFEEMKERILKIVDGYNGIPFTIQRLCELLTEPKRNYTGTDKFLRGVEKNVMVVSCVYPTSEKNGSSCVSRMNGVMFLGNASAFADRNLNGPGTPRPQNRPKLRLSSSVSSNGIPDSTENKEQDLETASDVPTSEAAGSSVVSKKNKHREEDEEEDVEAMHEAKRLKFDKDGVEEEEEDEKEEDEKDEKEEEEEEAAEAEAERKDAPCPEPAESSSDALESSACVQTETKAEDQEPSSTQPETSDDGSNKSETDDSNPDPDPAQSPENGDGGGESDISEQQTPCRKEEPTEDQDEEEKREPVSSSNSDSSEEESSAAAMAKSCPEPAPASPSSSTEPPAEGSSGTENSSDSSETADDITEQD